jgi:hypothetical protein
VSIIYDGEVTISQALFDVRGRGQGFIGLEFIINVLFFYKKYIGFIYFIIEK